MREYPGTLPEAWPAAQRAQRNAMMGTGSDHAVQRNSFGQTLKRQSAGRREKLSEEERLKLLQKGSISSWVAGEKAGMAVPKAAAEQGI